MNKKPCIECPFRRDSFPGYLGSADGDPKGFIGPHWYGELHLPCHMTVDWETEDELEKSRQIEEGHTCIGYATLMKNTCKTPLNKKDREAVKTADRDAETVFKWFHEFIDHHTL